MCCEKCQKQSRQQKNLQTHSGQNHTPSDRCSFKKVSLENINIQERKIHSEGFACNQCKFKSEKTNDIEKHISSHHCQHDIINCDKCPENNLNYGQNRNHKRTHSNSTNLSVEKVKNNSEPISGARPRDIWFKRKVIISLSYSTFAAELCLKWHWYLS